MNIKDRINMIKAKQEQIEALLSAKEKEVEEEYQMVMELYNGVSERVEVIKTKQKQTEETLDKYDSLLSFLNDELSTEEETTVNEPVKEGDIVVVEEEPVKKSDSNSSVEKKKWNINTNKEQIDEPPKQEVKEGDIVVDETLTQEDRDKVKQEEIDELLKMI